MSNAQDRRAAQDAFDRDQQDAMHERPAEPTASPSRNPQSWASSCAGWRIGIHERYKEDRLAGIYKCKWCGQTFDPPTDEERALMRAGALNTPTPRIQRPSRWRR